MEKLLKPKSRQHIEESIHNELYAAHTYQYIAAQMQVLGFFGAQAFFEKEAAAELEHYKELRDFANDMGEAMPMPQLDIVSAEMPDIQAALMMGYETEKYLLEKYEERANDCLKNGDIAVFSLLVKFVDKQVKSVGEFGDLISRMYKNPKDVFEFDEYLKNI